MLQKLRDDIMSEFGKIGETRSGQFAALGEDLSTTKKSGEWKTTYAEELNLIRTRKATLKEKNRIIERWKELEIRRATIRKDVAELDVAYANTRQELEIHFEDIGNAAFELYQQEPSIFDEAADLLEDMQGLESVIRDKERELQQLQSEAKPNSFLGKTLKKGRGIVIRGGLRTRGLRRGKRLKLVGEHIAESGILPKLPEGSSLAGRLVPLRGAMALLRETKQHLADRKEEADSIDKERTTIERGARMRNPVKNLEHEIDKLSAELTEICCNLGRSYYESNARQERLSERISRALSSVDRLGDDEAAYEKLLVRVDAALAIAEMENRKRKVEREQKSVRKRLEELEHTRSDIQARIDAGAKVRGDLGTLKLPGVD